MFTYDGDPAASDLAALRYLLHDTTEATAYNTDEELTYLLTVWPNVYESARAGAEVMAARFAQESDTAKKVGDLSISTTAGAQAETYRALAATYAAMGGRVKSPAAWTSVETSNTQDDYFTQNQFGNAG